MIHLEAHPLLAPRALRSVFPAALERHPSPPWLQGLLALDASVPLLWSEELRAAVRDMLRKSGYKPTGRGKPASEYLRKTATDGALGGINCAVDVCNVVSLHSGFPISVVDLARAREPFKIQVARGAESYVFNSSGQTIDLDELLCLFDAEGACANAVKDSQRTKTQGSTTETLSVVWGVVGHEIALDKACAWYSELLARAGARSEAVAFQP
ncbi:MAG TPA: phenylalanine--tRNA ligase beta subunit-related protein [Planctomycetota bacterium]|nr:phenylalanine--tRNA ligase beta subunit-related protein [Planctomycetota bacterium]